MQQTMEKPGMTPYIGTKLINACPMTRQDYNDLRGWTVPEDENPADDGYLVEYLDGGQPNHPNYGGYISWSPKGVFGRAYQPTGGLTVTFGCAVALMKNGSRMKRAEWMEGIYLRMDDGKVSIINADLTEPWEPTITDVLADDWAIC